MKLHDNQLRLIRHLIRFKIMRYEDCLQVLDTEGTGDSVALSYQFRPLTKHKYLGKNEEGIVTVLKKGRELFLELGPLFYVPGRTNEKERILQISRMCALMERNGVPVTDEIPEDDEPHFIPSACWRKIADGILSTTRFLGMFLAYRKKYAVYDIGDGTMAWQVRAESSLFYYRYGSIDTCANGMIFICEDGKRESIAKQIIRQTMWNRKALLSTHYAETDKPQRVSHAPIRLRYQYEHVYLTTPATLSKSLEQIYGEVARIAARTPKWDKLQNPANGDLEHWPHRYFLNPGYDLLKLVFFFSEVKDQNKQLQDPEFMGNILQYHIVMHKEDLPILGMYPDVLNTKEVTVHVFTA